MMSSLNSVGPRRALVPGIGLVLVTVLISGVSNFLNFGAVQGTDVDAWITVRNGVVALMLVPLALLVRPAVRTPLRRSDWIRLAVIGLVGGTVPFLLYFHGFQMAAAQGGAASASIGYRSLFLIATVLGVLFLGETVRRGFVLAAGLLLAGNVLLLSFTGPLWTDGTGYVLLATGLWAGEYTLSKRVLRTVPAGTVALGRMGFGAVFLLGYLGVTGHGASIAGFGGANWMTLFLSALLLFAFVATWYTGLKTVDLSVATSLLLLSFPITWALGIMTARSPLSLEQAAGAAAIGAGAGLVIGWTTLRKGWASFVLWARSVRARAG